MTWRQHWQRWWRAWRAWRFYLLDALGYAAILVIALRYERTAAVGEVLVCLLVIYGLGSTVRNLHDAIGDRHFIEVRRLDGGRILVAKGNERREQFRVTALVAALALGLLLLLAPPRVPAQAGEYRWVAPAVNIVQPLAILALVGIGIVGNSQLDRWERRALLDLLRRIEEEEAELLRRELVAQQTAHTLRRSLASVYQPEPPTEEAR